MPIESLQAPVPGTAPVTATGASTTPSGLPAGLLEARVAAVLDDGTVRFTTAFGTVDLTPDQPLALGTRAQLLVENTGIRILLTQLAAADARTAALPVSTSGLTAAARAQVQPDPATPVAQNGVPAPASTLAAAARAATATQQSPAALLSRLLPLLTDGAGALPPDVQRAAAQLAALPLRADGDLDPAVLQQAMRQSGVFREARLATSARAPDWKQALLGLRDALQAWSPPAFARTGAEPEAAPSGSLPGSAGTAQAPDGTPSAPAGGVGRAAPPAMLAQLAAALEGGEHQQNEANGLRSGPAPGPSTAAASAASARTPVSEAALMAALAEDGAAQRLAATPQLLGALVAKAFGAPAPERQAGAMPQAGTGPEAPQPGLEHRPAPPRADQPPRAPEPRPLDASLLDASPQDQRDTLLALTEGALDRVRLSQFASLPRETAPTPQQAPQPGQPHAPAWVFDVPVLVGRETAVAQFRVSRDGRGNAAAGTRPAWSVDVAIDTAETGPVHARVRLGGDGIGVTLWAERPDTAEALRREMPALRRSLDDAAFTVEDVAVLTGAPQAPPARASGYFLDRRS